MNIIFSFFITLSLALASATPIIPFSTLEKYFPKEQIEYDCYHNINIKIKRFSSQSLKNIKILRNHMIQNYPRVGLFIHLPLTSAVHFKKLEDMEFELYALDRRTKSVSFVYKNERGIPQIYNSYAGTAIFVIRKNPETCKQELLIVNDGDKPHINVVGGAIDNHEFAADGAVREVKEEINLTILPENLQLLAVRNGVDFKRDVNSYGFYYLCQIFEGNPQSDGKEILDFEWVPLEDVLQEDFTRWGKKFHATYKRVLTNAYESGVLKIQTSGTPKTVTSHEYQVSAFAQS